LKVDPPNFPKKKNILEETNKQKKYPIFRVRTTSQKQNHYRGSTTFDCLDFYALNVQKAHWVAKSLRMKNEKKKKFVESTWVIKSKTSNMFFQEFFSSLQSLLNKWSSFRLLPKKSVYRGRRGAHLFLLPI